MSLFHDNKSGSITEIDEETDLSLITEVCCYGHTISHTDYEDTFLMPLSKDIFSRAWKTYFEKNLLAIDIESCKNIDILERLLLQCPLEDTFKNRCKKIFTRDYLNNLLDYESSIIFNEYYDKIQKCKDKSQLSEILLSQDIIENESLYNYYGYLKKLIAVRDSDTSKYIPSQFCPASFTQIGIHPTTLQYLEISDGCQYVSIHDIQAENRSFNKDYYITDNKFKNSMNEVCIICGGPCRTHHHLPPDGFTTNVWESGYDENGKHVWTNLLNGENLVLSEEDLPSDYINFTNLDTILCGGRKQMIARVWGIYTEFIKCENLKKIINIENKNQNNECKENAAKTANIVANNKKVLDYIQNVITQSPPFIFENTPYAETMYTEKKLISMDYSIKDLDNKMQILLIKRRILNGGNKRRKISRRIKVKQNTRRSNTKRSNTKRTNTNIYTY